SNMAARLVDQFRERFLSVSEFADQALVRIGFLDRVKIAALDILEQRDLERIGIVELADDDRDFVQPRALRRAPAALAGDDLVVPTMRADKDRLEHAARRNRLRQF